MLWLLKLYLLLFRNLKISCIFVQEIPLANSYISVKKNYKFWVWIETIFFLKVQEMLIAYHYWSVLNIFHEVYLLVSVPLWHIQTKGQLLNCDWKKAFNNFFCGILTKGGSRDSALSFELTFLHKFSIWYWNSNLSSKILSTNFSFFVFVMVKSSRLIFGFSVPLSRNYTLHLFCLENDTKGYTTWKVSLFGVLLVLIFLHSEWIRRDTTVILFLTVHLMKTSKQSSRWSLLLKSE